MLRPLTILDNAALTITAAGDNDWSRKTALGDISRMMDKYKVDFRKGEGTVDLTGKTVSVLVGVHRGINRIAKSAKKDGVIVKVAYLGEAAGYDLDGMAKEPTPAEDHDCLKKARKGAALTGAKWARALELMGLNPETVKEGRKLVGFKVTLPGMDEDTYEIKYGSLAPSGEPEYEHHPEGPEREAYEARKEEHWAAKAAAQKAIVELASKALGLEDPDERAGLPTRSRDYRTDLTIRTCPVCFRDIKASGHTHGLMADHGYTINGRDYSGYGGERMGSCTGTGRLPWEKSCDPAKEFTTGLLDLSKRVEDSLEALTTGKVTKLKVNGDYNWKTRTYAKVEVTPADGRKWEKALASAVFATKRDLTHLWNGDYGSIPWMRMAVRTWTPVADDHVAIGAPNHPTVEADFAGMPAVLG